MVWTNQKYWQDSGVPLAYFGVLWAGYNLIAGLAGRSAALGGARYGRRSLLAAVGLLPIIAYFGMASFLGWGGILFGTLVQVSRGLGEVLFLRGPRRQKEARIPRFAMEITARGTRRKSSC